MDSMWKVFILMVLQAIIGLVVWMFINEMVGAMIVWLAVGIDFVAIGIERLRTRYKR